MTAVEQEIYAELQELEGAVEEIRKGTKRDLMGIFSRIETLTNSLPKGTDPQLLHYLHKKSFQKARLHLEGRDAENPRGTC